MDIKKRGFVVAVIFFASIILSSNFVLAEWTEELNDDLIAYYNFSQGFELTDIVGTNDLYQIGSPINNVSNGLIGNGWGGFSSSNYLINATDSVWTLQDNKYFTINVWVNFKTIPTSGKRSILSMSANPGFTTGWELFEGDDGAGNHPIYFYSNAQHIHNSNAVENTNVWYMVTVIHNSSGIFVYKNATLDSQSLGTTTAFDKYNFYIGWGKGYSDIASLDGSIDELGLWVNRSLTNGEIEQLYNNGNGITYTNDFSVPSNQSDLWTLNGTNLYTSNNNYKVGIGTSIPSTALEVIGEILASDDVCISGGICLSDFSGINLANFALINTINTFTSKQNFDGGIVVNGDTNISGNLYLNGKDIYASLPQIIKVTENISTSSTTLTDITGLNFNVTAGKYYHFRFIVPFRSSVTGTGLKLSLSVPSYAMFSAKAHIPRGVDGPGAEHQGWITYSDDAVTGSGVQVANTDYLAIIEGVIKPSADGVVQARFASETTNTVTIREGSIEFLYQI